MRHCCCYSVVLGAQQLPMMLEATLAAAAQFRLRAWGTKTMPTVRLAMYQEDHSPCNIEGHWPP